MAGTSMLEVDLNESSVSSISQQTDDFSDVEGMIPGTEILPGTSGECSDSPLLLDSVSTDSNASCRICKYNAGDDLVASPCHCKGSMGWVHVSCLEEWLTGSTRNSCELCSCPFTVERIPKYSYLRSIWIFLHTRISIYRLLHDFFFLTVSLMNTCILMYMWFKYIFRDVLVILDEKSLKKQSEVSPRFLTSSFQAFAYFLVFTLCLVFVGLNAIDDFRRIFYYYFLPWYRWWKASVDVKLVIKYETKPKTQ